MRILVWFVLGFGAGCALFAGFGEGVLLYAFIAFSLLLAFALCFCRKNLAIKAAALIFAGALVGLSWSGGYGALHVSTAKLYDESTKVVSITARDYLTQGNFSAYTYGDVELDGKTYRVRVYLPEDTVCEPGTVLEGKFRFRVSDSSYDRGMGVFLQATYLGKVSSHAGDADALRFIPIKLRHYFLSLLDRVMEPDTAPFAKALLLGDTAGIDFSTDWDLQISGIRHIIAVSGLHVSMLCALLYLCAGSRRYGTAIAGILILVLFAAVAGFTPSISRAVWMMCMLFVSILVRREYDGPTALALAALVLLIANPFVILSVSFQLSFGCVAGILCFSKPLLKSMQKVLASIGISGWIAGFLGGSVSVTISAQAFTVPLVAYYFGVVSLLGVFTNLLCLWIVSIVFAGILGICILGSVWIPAGVFLGKLVSWGIRYILTVAKWMASVPFCALYTENSWVVVWIVFAYAVITFAVFRKAARKGGALAVTFSLLLVLGYSWADGAYGSSVAVLDVGQGQCVVLQDAGKTYVVDCGANYAEGSAETAMQYLLSKGITRVDALIVTHFDLDHAGGVPYLLSRIQADAIYIPAYEENDLSKEDNTRIVNNITQLTHKDTVLTIIPATTATTENESGLCVLFQTKKYDILITGDRGFEGEIDLLSQIVLPDLEVLVAGHHGAADATGENLLAATDPEILIISVGADNNFGHPSQALLERAEAWGCLIRRTDLEGTIIYRG